ncbi:MAG: helix-turn-helix transcriptional regulator [Bacteroidetes bacterium]|nr:helix-turn-helix transcriptional regulator [Bacteroidota bacterium]
MALHIGKLIRKRIEQAGMNKSEFARRINSTPQNVYSIFKRESIDTDLLWEISRVLNYDFFQHYTTSGGAYLNDDSMSYKNASELNKELAQVKRDTELFAQENRYLKELVRLLRGRTEGLPFELPEQPAKTSDTKKSSQKQVSQKNTKTTKANTKKQPKTTKAAAGSSLKRK